MSGYREHTKFAIGCLVILTFVLFALNYYGSISFLHDDFLGFFEIHSMNMPIIIIAFALGIYASLLPDIDIGTSKVYQFTVTMLLFLCIIFILSGTYKFETVAILLFIISLFYLDHRGMTHSLWFGLFTAILFAYIFGSITIFLFVIVGYYSHLLKDR